MLTGQDIKSIKKVRNTFYEKESIGSCEQEIVENLSQDEIYFSRYFLNDNFKILHLTIVGVEKVTSSLARLDSYMVYVIKIMTADFSYEIRRRYSQFLNLFEIVMSYDAFKGKMLGLSLHEISSLPKRIEYRFPVKKIACSLKNLFNPSNKQKMAQQRKPQLTTFMNQIKNNYYKFPSEFSDDYIELLKFIDMKCTDLFILEEHQKFWKQKENRFLQLSNMALKDSHFLNQSKTSQQNQPINIDHLCELLQHQINKINLSVISSCSNMKMNVSMNRINEIYENNETILADEIIKNVQCIKDIVLEMKRRINVDHIKCIMKGKDIKDKNSLVLLLEGQKKKGLIEFVIKYANNQLVIIHILKVFLNVFFNCESNYSCDLFLKIYGEIEVEIISLNQDKEQLALGNKEFRELYFKMVKMYIFAKQQNGEKNEKNYVKKMMGLMLGNMYEKWSQKFQKNKEFKMKQEQKEWTFTDGIPQKGCKKSNFYPNESYFEASEKNKENNIQISRGQLTNNNVNLHEKTELRKYEDSSMKVNLQILKQQQNYEYRIRGEILNMNYQKCCKMMRNEKDWNKLMIDSQIDTYSNTYKIKMKVPGKNQKIFRFVQEQCVDLVIQEKEWENCVCQKIGFDDDEISSQLENEKNNKRSIQTMPSVTGSCEQLDQFESSKCKSMCLVKCPPKQGLFNSFTQKMTIQSLNQSEGQKQGCIIKLDLTFSQPTAIKYFMKELNGETDQLWSGFIQFLVSRT